jgi:hypothetical protein
LLDAAYIPSLSRVWHLTLRVLLLAVLGSVALGDLLHAGANVHRRLADSGRKRKPQLRYPIRR